MTTTESRLIGITFMELTQPKEPRKGGQNYWVLDLLRSFGGHWCSMEAISSYTRTMGNHSLNIHSRIADLRRMGWTIENKTEGQKPKRSFYRLVR